MPGPAWSRSRLLIPRLNQSLKFAFSRSRTRRGSRSSFNSCRTLGQFRSKHSCVMLTSISLLGPVFSAWKRPSLVNRSMTPPATVFWRWLNSGVETRSLYGTLWRIETPSSPGPIETSCRIIDLNAACAFSSSAESALSAWLASAPSSFPNS